MFRPQPGNNEGTRTQNNTCPSFRAFFRLLPDRRLRIFFLKRGLSPAIIRYYFGNGQFIMPSPFDLPCDLLKTLGLDYYRIQAGAYSVQEDTEFLMVDV